MRSKFAFEYALLGTVGLSMALPASARAMLPMNTPTNVHGVSSVCTGIGYTEEHNPDWKPYPLKVVVAGKEGQYLSGSDISISHGGKSVAEMHCDGPWVLLKLSPGRYRITADRNGKSESGIAYAPDSGQGRIILRFRDQGGAVSTQYLHSLG